MKRCLFLAPRYAPFPGGAETYARDLCSHLPDNGWHCVVLTDASTETPAAQTNEHAPTIIRFEVPLDQLNDKSRVRWRTLQFGLLDEIEPALGVRPKLDIVHANSIEALILGRMIADHYGIPLVATIHEHAPEKQSFGLGRLKLAFQRLAPDMLIAPSNFYYDRGLAAGIPSERIARISHGVSAERVRTERRRDWRAEWGFSSEIKCAVLIGRIYQPKGILEFVKATNLLKEMSQFRAVIVGPDGPGQYGAEVRRQIALHGLDSVVRLTGEVSPEEIPSIIRSADLIVAPSLAEGFGLSVVESMLLGVPVLASRVGGLAEIINDGVTGELVEPGNVSSLAEAIKRLLQQDDLRRRYSNAAFVAAEERFSASRMAAETANLYQELRLNLHDPWLDG